MFIHKNCTSSTDLPKYGQISHLKKGAGRSNTQRVIFMKYFKVGFIK